LFCLKAVYWYENNIFCLGNEITLFNYSKSFYKGTKREKKNINPVASLLLKNINIALFDKIEVLLMNNR